MRFTMTAKPCKGDPTMSHLVFSTNDRRMLLRDKERGELHSYITGILKNKTSPLNSFFERHHTSSISRRFRTGIAGSHSDRFAFSMRE